MSSTTMPTAEEFIGMFEAVCRQRDWSRRFLASLLNISDADITNLRVHKKLPSAPACRLIWFFFTLTTAPDLAMNVAHIMSWGTTSPKMKVPEPYTEEVGQRAVEIIKDWDNHHSRKLTIAKVARMFNTTQTTAKKLIKRAGYKPGDGRRSIHLWERRQWTPSLLQAHSPWLRTDWRKKDKEIAAERGVTVRHAYVVRRKYRHMAPRTLRIHLKRYGINEDWYEIPIFARSLWGKKKNNISLQSKGGILFSDRGDTNQSEPVQLRGEAAEREVSAQTEEAKDQTPGHDQCSSGCHEAQACRDDSAA